LPLKRRETQYHQVAHSPNTPSADKTSQQPAKKQAKQ